MKKIDSLIAYTFSHFCVDFACFFVAFRYIFYSFDIATCTLFFVLYNVLAFGLQGIIGYYADEKADFPAGIVGCALVLISLFLPFAPYIAIVVAGVGNAFFHVGGGIDSLKYAEGKMSRSGVFVSSGALGVTMGTIYGLSNLSSILPISLLVVCIISIYILAESKQKREYTSSLNIQYRDFNFSKTSPFTTAIILSCIAIFIRCFGGYKIPLDWYDNTVIKLAFFYGLACVLGKGIGGFLGDKFGGTKIGVILLVASIPFLMLGNENMLLSLIGICLFNTSMPITLCIIYSKLNKNAGLAFGISTLALLFGTFPSVFGLTAYLNSSLVLPISIVISAMCIYFATIKKIE